MVTMKTKSKMTTILPLTILLLILLLLGACSRICGGNDEPLSIQRTDFTGTNLRIDGYFYNQFNDTHISVLFLYRNGIVFRANVLKGEQEQRFLSEEWLTPVRNHKGAWGVFLVDGGIIKIESRANAWCRPFQSFIREGVILNDTTFRITKSYNSFGTPDVRSMDRTYHFRAFSPKPDSTNVFIR